MADSTFTKVPGYQGIYTRPSSVTQATGRTVADISFYARLQKGGKRETIFLGSKLVDKMTAATAAQLRLRLLDGQTIPTPKRARTGKTKKATGPAGGTAADDYLETVKGKPADYWTFDRLWDQYVIFMGGANGYANHRTDKSRYERHIKPICGHLHPADITTFFVATVRNTLKGKTYIPAGTVNAIATRRARLDAVKAAIKATRKKKEKAQLAAEAEALKADIKAREKRAEATRRKLNFKTIESCLELMRRLANFGAAHKFCPGPADPIRLEKVNDEKTEDMTPEQIRAFLEACAADENQEVADMLCLALFTGLRRGSIFALAWRHINFQKETIKIKSIEQQGRHSKGGLQIDIPMNPAAKQILEKRARLADLKASPYVFPGRNGGRRVCTPHSARRICRRAGLPDHFRPFHGQRHSFATNLVHTGVVDLSIIGKLLGHSPNSPGLTTRYTHMRDNTLKNASNMMADIVSAAAAAGLDADGDGGQTGPAQVTEKDEKAG